MTSCLVKLTQIAPDLTKSEKKAADYILQHPQEVIGLPVSQLAERASVSGSAIIRLCKRMNFSGYREFAFEMSKEYSAIKTDPNIEYSDFHIGDDIRITSQNVCKQNQTAIDTTCQILDFEMLQAAAAALDRARRIDFFGIGASSIVAMDAQQKFLRLGKQCNYITDLHLQLLNTASMSQGDVGLFISYSGTTNEVVRSLSLAKSKGATTISITKFGENLVSALADIQLYVSALEPQMRIGAIGSRISQLTMVDILYTHVVASRYEHYKDILIGAKKTVQELKEKG